ncbi:hypothetical protein HZ326_3375 [Fusarium oxysporum f. sp. albedinis]|nr:hypothetical protein HZ326_3375 [Fusarium oxysporum f. sp. albedinis]
MVDVRYRLLQCVLARLKCYIKSESNYLFSIAYFKNNYLSRDDTAQTDKHKNQGLVLRMSKPKYHNLIPSPPAMSQAIYANE